MASLVLGAIHHPNSRTSYIRWLGRTTCKQLPLTVPFHSLTWLQIRWSRGIHLHRVHDYQYILSQGYLYTAYMIRSGLYDPLLFLWIAYYAIMGQQLVTISLLDLICLEVIPPVYNYFRSTEPRAGLHRTIAHYLSYRAISPAYRMYTFLTPQKDSWALPPSHAAEAVSKWFPWEAEMAFLYFWFFIAACAGGRLVIGF